MDYPTNGPGSGGPNDAAAGAIDPNDVAQRMREYADDATQGLQEAFQKGREMVLRNPVLSVAGAVAAGYLFARIVARRR